MMMMIAVTQLQTTEATSGGAVTAVTNCCADCVETLPPPSMGARFTVLGKVGHAYPLDG